MRRRPATPVTASLAAIQLCLLAVGTSARADVLEVGGEGATWIAGAPRQVAPTPAGLAGPAPPSLAPVTVALPLAGPAQWQGEVARLAAKYDLSPALLEAVVWQESRWNHNAVSPAGARGLAQLMPGTARDLGVDPRDPVANLEGGARYLRQMLDQFGGDVERALAAYNAGPTRVDKAGGVPAISETRNYVAAILGRLNQQTRR